MKWVCTSPLVLSPQMKKVANSTQKVPLVEISPNTVKFHLKTAFERTGSRSQTDLVRRALRILTDLDA